jgi:hypothetical protein
MEVGNSLLLLRDDAHLSQGSDSIFLFHNVQGEFFTLLFLESIPKMLGLKKLELGINYYNSLIWWDSVLEGTTKETLQN